MIEIVQERMTGTREARPGKTTQVLVRISRSGQPESDCKNRPFRKSPEENHRRPSRNSLLESASKEKRFPGKGTTPEGNKRPSEQQI